MAKRQSEDPFDIKLFNPRHSTRVFTLNNTNATTLKQPNSLLPRFWPWDLNLFPLGHSRSELFPSVTLGGTAFQDQGLRAYLVSAGAQTCSEKVKSFGALLCQSIGQHAISRDPAKSGFHSSDAISKYDDINPGVTIVETRSGLRLQMVI